jgi:hypothetical protein
MSTMTEEPLVGDRGADDECGTSSGYADCSTEGVAATAGDLARLHAVVHAELLGVLRELDGRDRAPGGCRDLVEWCQASFGVLAGTAREWLRVAVALGDLPHLAALYGSGAVTWDHIRHAIRFATPDTDELVAGQLVEHTAAQIAQLAREHAARNRDDDTESDRWARCRVRRDHRLAGTYFTLFLPDGDSEPLRATLERRAQQIGPDPVTGIWDTAERRMAQAAAMLGAADLAADGDLDRALAVIHIDADVLAGEHPGNAATDTGGVISAEVARRLCCDGWIQYVADDADDNPVGVGRRQRTVPRWLRRLIRHRDGRCRCCGGPIHHIHHIVHWTFDGPTDETNLVGLCWGCHHRVHEGGWTITGDPRGPLTFTNPYGESRTTTRQPLARGIRRRTTRATGIHLGPDRPDPRTSPPDHGPSRVPPDDPARSSHQSGAGPPPPD